MFEIILEIDVDVDVYVDIDVLHNYIIETSKIIIWIVYIKSEASPFLGKNVDNVFNYKLNLIWSFYSLEAKAIYTPKNSYPINH